MNNSSLKSWDVLSENFSGVSISLIKPVCQKGLGIVISETSFHALIDALHHEYQFHKALSIPNQGLLFREAPFNIFT